MQYQQAIHLHDEDEDVVGTVMPLDQNQFNGEWDGIMESWKDYLSTHENPDIQEFCNIWNSYSNKFQIVPLSIYFYQP
ncbi:MAG: hypothetical protein MJH10_19875 [Epibacterium sp.]|nr:hypothetical protein [Epibacterium sp.]NQX75740.1 hypothetical protein [Epibacterium sp.]